MATNIAGRVGELRVDRRDMVAFGGPSPSGGQPRIQGFAVFTGLLGNDRDDRRDSHRFRFLLDRPADLIGVDVWGLAAEVLDRNGRPILGPNGQPVRLEAIESSNGYLEFDGGRLASLGPIGGLRIGRLGPGDTLIGGRDIRFTNDEMRDVNGLFAATRAGPGPHAEPPLGPRRRRRDPVEDFVRGKRPLRVPLF